MLYLLLTPRNILIIAAILPSIILLLKIYKNDRLEKENPRLIFILIFSGIFSTIIATILEQLGSYVLPLFITENTKLYNIIFYYIVVAFSEETSKYILLRRKTWNNIEFNCKYDAIVYAVSVSMGFALWENILYVFRFGLSAAFTRAFTAIPGHASFSVAMGLWYGISKKYSNEGSTFLSKVATLLSLLVPILLHGTYDYICSNTTTYTSTITFILFIIVLFTFSYIVVKKESKNDRYI